MFDWKRPLKMGEFYRSRKNKWENTDDDGPPPKEPRTTNQLLLFCDLILTYEKYKPYKEEMNDSAYSPSNSEGGSDSFSSSESNSSFNNSDSAAEELKNSDNDADSDSWNLITCYCMKPFANRPMIECSVCGTWLHMSCAIVRSNKIPDFFVCQVCREAKSSRRRSARIKGVDRRFFHHS